jgi:hypothetical protein
MNNLTVLLKAELINGLALNKWFHPGEGRRHTLRMYFVILAAVFLVILAFSLSAVYMAGLAQFLHAIGAFRYYMAFAIILPWICIFFTSLYMMPSYLLVFNDFDLLMALPVRPSTILTSKMLFLYLIDSAVTVLIAGPIFIIAGSSLHAGAGFYVMALLAVPFIPLVPMLFGALTAYLIGALSARFRSAQYVLLVATVVLLLLACVLPLAMAGLPGGTTRQMTGFAQNIGRLCTILYPSVLIMNALRNTDIPSYISFILINVVPFLLFTAVFSRQFLTVHAKLKETGRSVVRHPVVQHASGLLAALFKKELKNYFSTYVYVINTSFGMILVTFLVIVLSVTQIPSLSQMIGLLNQHHSLLPALVAFLSFPVCMTCTSACSISLDGKTIWLDKSLPVPETRIFISKILLNLAVILPLLFVDVVILSLKFLQSPVDILLLLAIPSLYGVLVALSGLLINLYFPKLVWPSPVTPVKQSLSVIVASLTGMIIIVVPAVLYLLLQADIRVFLSVLLLLLLITNAWIWHKLKTTGVRLYRHLE